jgi:hypothetical protein
MAKAITRLLLVGGVAILIVFVIYGMVCTWFIMTPSLCEETPPTVSKGTLTAGISSGRQEITVPWERHLYEFSGEADQTIEIRIHPYSQVYMSGYIATLGYSEHDSVQAKGEPGNDLVMTAELPTTTVYRITVTISGGDTGYYEVQITILSE